jgi:hypothetical protein
MRQSNKEIGISTVWLFHFEKEAAMLQKATKRTVLLTWELGGELGHLACLSTISQAYVKQGFNVVLALKDLSRAHTFFPAAGQVTVIQAPVWLPNTRIQRPVTCLADVLLLKGYLRPETLRSLFDAWRALLVLIQPDLLICNYSPTAMLASCGLDLPRINVGSGFVDPVPGQCLLDWRHNTLNDRFVKDKEQLLLNSIHAAIGNTIEFEYYADIYQCDATFITTLPQLDCYQEYRKQACYSIPSEQYIVNSQPTTWNNNSSPKILAYLKPQYPEFDAVLQALDQCDANVFVACPGGDPAKLAPHKGTHFSFSTVLADFSRAFQQIDVFVGHGNMATSARSLISGVPVAVLPIQLENSVNGRLIENIGVGLSLDKATPQCSLTDWFNNIIHNKELKVNAEILSQKSQILLEKPLHQLVFEASESL